MRGGPANAHAHDVSLSGFDPHRPLRIIAVVGDFPVVSKTFVTDQLLGLLDAGHDLKILADPPLPDRKLPDEQLAPAIKERITYRTTPARTRSARRRRGVMAALRGLLLAPRPTIDLLRSSELPPRRRQDLLETMLALLGLGNPDVYHCHFGMLGSDVLAARDRLGFSGRVATAFHGYDISRHIERRGAGAFDPLFAGGDLFLPISEHWRRRILDLGAPADRVQVQRMGVDTSSYEAITRPAPIGRRFRILSVGRFVEKKAFSDGVRAAEILRHRGLDFEYTIIGDGPQFEAISRLIEELDLKRHVQLPGSQSRESVLGAMRDHDVLLCPSATAPDGDAEGIPVVLMEAMATAMPVVSTWHSGIPELIEDERSGLLAAERDPTALADRLQRISENHDLALSLGRAARSRVEHDFDMHRLLTQLEQRLRVTVLVGGTQP